MVLVQGYPFLHWQMRYLKSQGVKKVVMAVSHHAHMVYDYFKESYLSIPLLYSMEDKPMGTGGAIVLAMQKTDDKSVIILNGDTYFPINLNKLMVEHKKTRNEISIAVKRMYNFDRYGTIDLNKTNRIIAFNEKAYKEKGYINGGVYIINKSAFNGFIVNQPFSIEKDVFEQKLKSLKIGAYRSRANFIDIGIPEEYNRIQTMNLK